MLRKRKQQTSIQSKIASLVAFSLTSSWCSLTWMASRDIETVGVPGWLSSPTVNSTFYNSVISNALSNYLEWMNYFNFLVFDKLLHISSRHQAFTSHKIICNGQIISLTLSLINCFTLAAGMKSSHCRLDCLHIDPTFLCPWREK